MILRFVASVAFIALTISSCALLPPSASPGPIASPSPPIEKRPGAELAGPTFRQLPPGSREYLESIADAVAAGNTAFLLTQGERDYAQRIRPAVDPGEYAALLYRVDAYSADSPAISEKKPRADLGRARKLSFTGWEENGPVLEVRGRLEFKDGTVQPCALFVLWKLSPPRILGREP